LGRKNLYHRKDELKTSRLADGVPEESAKTSPLPVLH